MKIIRFFSECDFHFLMQTFRIMRITLFLLLLPVLHAFASDGYAQKTTISVEFSQIKLADAMDEIEQRSEFYFLYNEKLVDTDREISGTFKSQKISTILDNLFAETDVVYTITDRKIILAPRFLSAGQQQQKTITGLVTDQSGEPVPGVNVVIKGTTRGTITDINGRYAISDVPEGATLQLSFIGMKNQEIEVGTQLVINVVMMADSIGLDEVVAIGYGTVKKSDLTGAMAVVGAEDLDNIPASNIQQALVGKVAGAFITQSQGANPSGGVSIRIRGTNSLNEAANSPLYVVDGIPMVSTDINFLDPENIETVSVLKDASSTAIYGARAAAGVILVTTKRGKIGKGSVTFSSEFGSQSPYKYYNTLNSEEFYKLYESGWDTWEHLTGGDRTTKGAYQEFYSSAVYDSENKRSWYDINHQKDLLRDAAPWQKYSASVSGGSDKMDYYFNISYEDREGIVKKTFFERMALNAKVNYKISDKLQTGFNTNISYSEDSGNGGLNYKFGGYMASVYQPSIIPTYKHDTGDWVYPSQEWKVDPAYSIAPYRFTGFLANNFLYDLETSDNVTDDLKTMVKFYFDFRPIKELSFNTNVGIDFGNGQSKGIDYLKPAMYLNINNPNGMDNVSTSVWFGKRQSYVVNEIINYKKTFAQNHNLDATAVFELQHSYADFLSVTANGSTDNDLDQIGNQPKIDVFSPNGTLINPRSFGGMPNGRTRFASVMARVNYDYANRYYITGSMRADGSSKFAEGNRWGTFGSVALSWHIHKEAFFENFTDVISQLKPRFSIGTTGNQASVASFLYLANVTTWSGVYGPISAPGNIPTNSLTWETLNQWNAGLDVSFINNRINLSADYYRKKSIDMLGDVPLPISSGYNNAKGNLGSIENKGVDISLSTVNIAKRNFTWTTDFTLSANKNKILDLGVNADGSKIDEVITDKFIRKIGQPVSNYYLYSYDGVWQEDQADQITPQNSRAGHNQVGLFRIMDRQAEGEEGHGVINVDDRKMMGDPLPDFAGGFTNNFTYKRVSLGVVCTYAVGGRLFNQAKAMLQTGHRFQGSDRDFAKNHWTPENPTNKYQKQSVWPANATHQMSQDISHNSSHWLEDADYLRIANVSLQYQIPERICNYIGMQRASLGANVSNLHTFTGYSGLDPAADKGYGTGNPSVRGVDEGGYPPARSYVFNLRVSF